MDITEEQKQELKDYLLGSDELTDLCISWACSDIIGQGNLHSCDVESWIRFALRFLELRKTDVVFFCNDISNILKLNWDDQILCYYDNGFTQINVLYEYMLKNGKLSEDY